MIKLSEEDLRELTFGGSTDEYEWVEDTNWESQGKYQTKDVIIKDKSGQHFVFYISRTGSDYTDWEYDFADCEIYPAKKVTKTIHVWEPIP